MEWVDLTPAVLRRASEPFPTALLWKQAFGPLVLATHHEQLRAAAVLVGFDVLG